MATTVAMNPAGGAPAVPVYSTIPAGVSGFQVLADMPAVYISQDIELLEVLTGCETQNKYKVYAMDPATKARVGEPIFRAKEKSSCFMRQCCGPNRAFEINIATQDAAKTEFIKLRRPFKCTCACLNRPVMYTQSAADEDLGEVYSPWDCCDILLDVRPPGDRGDLYGGVKPLPIIAEEGKSGEDWWQIKGACCQPGLICRCPCGPCKEVNFDIIDKKTAAPVGQLSKVWSGCGKEMFTDADNYALIFPVGATPYQKATLLASVFLLDFLVFEKKDQGAGGGGGGGGF